MEEKGSCCCCFPIKKGILIIGVLSSVLYLPWSIGLVLSFIYMLGWDSATSRLIFCIIYCLTIATFIALFAMTLINGEGLYSWSIPEDKSGETTNLIATYIIFGLISLINLYFCYVTYDYYSIAVTDEAGPQKMAVV